MPSAAQDLPLDAERVFRVAAPRAGRQLLPARPPLAPGDAISHLHGRAAAGGRGHRVHARGRAPRRRRAESCLPPGLKRGANVRPAGEDITLGRTIVPAGRWLRPQDVAVAAAMGLTELRVRRRVKVAVFSNGDEIVEPGSARRDAAVRFQSLHADRDVAASGLHVSDLGIRRDDRAQIAEVSARLPRARTI